MPNIKRANTSGITKSGVAIADVPDAPTIGTATDGGTGTSVIVTYTAATTGGTATTFTATSTPGSITGTGSSPITVTGLTQGTSYTFKVKGTNSTATGPESSASNSVTPILLGDYDLIATSTVVGSSTTYVEFANIPATYKYLEIRGYGSYTAAAYRNVSIQLGTTSVDTGANYGYRFTTYNNTNASAGATTGANLSALVHSFPTDSTQYNCGSMVFQVIDYAFTNKSKSLIAWGGGLDATGTGGETAMGIGTWNSNSAVGTIRLLNGLSPAFTAGSSFSLYGVKGAA
jgi:trimeric autotransporter adhesin